MTPSEVQLLVEMGNIIYLNASGSVIIWVLYGIFILSATIAIYLCLENSVKGGPRMILVVCMIILVLVNAWQYALGSAEIPVQIKFGLVNTLNGGLEDQLIGSAMAVGPINEQLDWPTAISLMLNDGTVIWRACAVWPHKKILSYGLITFMVSNIAVNVANCIAQDIHLDSTTVIILESAAILISFGVNLTATSAIGAKIWFHHRATRFLYSNRKQKHSPTIRILLLLIESGVLFCIAQLWLAVFQVFFTQKPATFSAFTQTFLIVNEFWNGILPIYPVAVLILLNLNRLPLEETIHHNSVVVDISAPAARR
ncbi:hypothetical protein BT96DRAFT_653136 [Gymnopus androsaceus JB14]|uniref:Fungal pheromone STE3G-protein-coupled receptor n=1 Tax=Gymnopus androsaceus JB14 TaxID=1447944 RepID=A0A6A4HRD3_9AGAR|nr:hypothetical protein BT96DRAFT_653136 [Gymnopus androsaceus JB14]